MNELKSYYKTVAELLWNEGHHDLSNFCNGRYLSDEIVDHDNWDGGIDTFNIVLEVPVSVFTKWQLNTGGIENKENLVEKAFETAVRGINSITIAHVTIRPRAVVDDNIQQTKKPLSLTLHFEVQTKEGKRSDYIDSVKQPKCYPCFILVFNWNWRDHDYNTWFFLFYFASATDKKKIGELKIMNSAQKNTMDALPEKFDAPLDDSFCSLGINTNYYV